jgi:phosphotransferase system enzyme I (PtsI)
MKMDKTGSKHKGRTTAAPQRTFEGLAVSPGVAIGSAHLRDSGEIRVLEYQVPVAKMAAEKARFGAAVERAKRQLGKLKGKATRFHGAAAEELGYLLDAHQHMLGSSRLLSGVEQRISKTRQNAEAAVMAEIADIAQSFEQMDDPYLRARAEEVREVGMRILRALSDQKLTDFSALPRGSIIIAEVITPADTALMDPAQVGGFATVLGGAEGHTAIMARSLGLPAVLGVAGLIEGVKTGETVIIDGSNGRVIVNPGGSLLADYQRRQRELERADRALARLRDVPAKTRDGERIILQANLELPREVGQAMAAGAEGVGLLRTEFLYMNRDDLPGEEEQYLALKQIIEAMDGRSVTVRTLDVGGEKLASALGGERSTTDNPALGLRAIRLSLKEPKLLDTQLAAILRAAAHGPVRILLPLITTVAEVREVRKALKTVSRRLRRSAAAPRRDDRGAGRGLGGRFAGPRGRLLCHRDQRSHHVHAGHRPRRGAGGASLQPLAPGGAQVDPVLGRGGPARPDPALDLRRDGRRPAFRSAVPGPGRARAVHDRQRPAAGQEPHSLARPGRRDAARRDHHGPVRLGAYRGPLGRLQFPGLIPVV